MFNTLTYISYLFVFLLAFSVNSEGRKKKSIIKFGFIGLLFTYLVALVVSINQKELILLGIIFEDVLVFAILYIVLYIILRKILKVPKYN